MIPWLIAAGVGAVILMANWDKLVNWLKDFTKRIADAFRGGIGHAAKLFATKIVRGLYKLFHVLFYKENYNGNMRWVKETTRVEVDESEVPAWAKEGVGEYETEVTNAYKRMYSLEI